MATEAVIQDARSRLSSLLEPIAGGVGADVSYDEIFENLKNEVDKLQSLAGGKPDWGAVASTADEILTDKSKDFRVAVYYAAAKSQLDGLSGLLDGLLLIRELSTAFWEPMYPALKRPKARGNLMGWYSDLAAPALESHAPSAKDADVAAAIEEVSRTVDAELRDKLGEAYPGIGALRVSIRNLLQNVPKEAPPPPPPAPKPVVSSQAITAPVETSSPAPEAGGGGPSLTTIVDADSALAAVSQCALLLGRAGDTLRGVEPTNPIAYRISRTGIWLELHGAPPAEGGTTLVPSPVGVRERFDMLITAENWLGVLQATDEVCSEYILWLDPHRFAANAMDRLGAPFANAKKALLREVGILLLRAPALPDLMFSDGTPFADAQTKMWIDTDVKAAVRGGGGGGNGAMVASSFDGPLQEARALAASGKLEEAIAMVTKAAASAPSQAERFRGKLALAKLCLQTEQLTIARAQLEGLDRLVVEHRLTEWEPQLCAELYAALYAAHRGLNRGEEVPPEARAREAAAFDKLCQLDAAAALKLAAT